MRITGKFVTPGRRLIQGIIGTIGLAALLLSLMYTGGFNIEENLTLDWLQRHMEAKGPAGRDIAILYIDQKSIDFFQRSRGIGWPWPRDAYALVVQFLKAAGAEAVAFDGVFSEPSVFVNDFDDDNAFASAMSDNGHVIQTLTFHKESKGGAPTKESVLAALPGFAVQCVQTGGTPLPTYQDVTAPIPELVEASWGLGSIIVEPDSDGIIRRLEPLAEFEGNVFTTLSLAIYLKTEGLTAVEKTNDGLRVGERLIPLDENGRVLVKYYGGLDAYPSYTIAAVIQSAMDLMQQKKPMLDPDEFKDKIVFIGASAAGLYDLKATPMGQILPGVIIHANLLDNIRNGDFLRRAPFWQRAVLLVFLLTITLMAAVFSRSAVTGAGITLLLAALYSILVALAFRFSNTWLDLVRPLGGQALVFLLATLVNYYGEGREKKAIRGAFARYLSPDVVTEVIQNPAMLSLGGSRRIMTCFFSDMAGFTSISEGLDPEALVHLLNRYLSRMTRVIMASGGTVDKFEGDAIMAFWGAPLEQEDHAWRACQSALDQQAVMAEFREQALGEGLPELRVRMGLNTGPMIVGNMGSEERFDYTVMGDAVNLASRLEGANKQYGTEIMISEATYALVKERVEVRELDLIRVKGKNEPIRVFELVGRKGETSPDLIAVLDEYRQGLDLYRSMDFKRALKTFESVLSKRTDDGPSKTYLARCQMYLDEPPPEDWDRVFTMTTK